MSSGENNDSKEVYLAELAVEAQTAVGRQLASLTDAVLQGAMNWGFEVIKHLAIFNGAGLAAMVAIAQVAGVDRVVKGQALHGAHFFVVGLIFALCAMVTIYFTGLSYVRHLTTTTMSFMMGSAPLSALSPGRKMFFAIGLNWLLAGISIGFFLVGAFCLVSIS
jgi:hypothetical protein